MKFAPLNVISGYSFLQSGLTIDKIASSAKKNDYFGVGICDAGVLYGLPSFVDAMKKNKQKFILGMRITLDDSYGLFAINEDGYRNLIFLSKCVSEDSLTYDRFINHLNGLVVVLETNYGEFANLFKSKLTDEYLKRIAKLSSFPKAFYLGLEVTTKAEFKTANQIREFAKERGYETIAFPRIQYQNTEDAIILKIVEAIERNDELETKELKGQSFFQTNEAYSKLYTKDEIKNTGKVLEINQLEFSSRRGEMLHYPTENAKDTLKSLVYSGLKSKGLEDDSHLTRANYELDVICSMGYEDYFLIVADYVNYAKTHNILVGPGRGSAAGSLVSYAIGITEVDPLEYDLQFERFLNKARKTMPDIDIDFMDIARDDMVQYMRDKYGDKRVSSIATFQTIQAKQALRDIGRVYKIPTHHIDLLSKSITDKSTLRDAYKKLETFRNLVDSDKYFLEIVTLASKIENLPRQAGMHAAGIILNNSPIDEVLPITVDLSNHLISQYEKDYLEDQGFLKMDFLSLRNLTTIDLCLKLINKNKNLNLDFYSIPYNDSSIAKIIGNGYTAGIFQLESAGMKSAIKILKPKEFNDVVALLSLFRPGPMDNIKEYQNRKEGKVKVNYLNNELKKILAPTYGIIIYQEQINSIATAMAGFSLEKADLFRRAVSHKNKEELLSAKTDFVNGAIKKGYKESVALATFEDILKFANYGFNKSHAVVYGIIATRMAYLKCNYPLEFYTSLLMTSSGVNDTKFSEYVNELSKRNLSVYNPDINESTTYFLPKEKGLLFPLNYIHGVSDIVSHKIVEERMTNGEYKDFFDFVKRTYTAKISESVINRLIDAGCFDKLYPCRDALKKTTKFALQMADLSYDKDGQMILDATIDGQKNYFEGKDDPFIKLSLEYEALGIMLSDNPLRYKKDLLQQHNITPLEEAKDNWGKITIAGIINNIKTIKTRKSSNTMAFVKLIDETGEIEVTIFPKTFTECYSILLKNNIIMVKGRYDHNEEKESFVADEIKLLED